jgi:hypothetical protein
VEAIVHVVRQVLGDRLFECWYCARYVCQTLILKRPVEPLHVCVVVALPNARVPVCKFETSKYVREACGEFWTVIGLYHVEAEWRTLLRP